MSEAMSPSVPKDPEQYVHAREIPRRLAGLGRAPVRLIPDQRGANPRAAEIWRGQWTSPERAAAQYYESLGYEVVRLSHETSTSVGKAYESRIPGAAQLAHAMRRILPAAVFRAWTAANPRLNEIPSLNYVPPHEYPVSAYPPDLLCARSDDWRFVEVKGPGDRLHFRQANWLIHCREPAWAFEVCMPLRGLSQAQFIFDETGPGPAFAAAYAEALQEHEDFLVIASMHKMVGDELVAAEDRNAVSIIRSRRRLWAGLAAAGHDPRSLNVLRSGRPMTALDPTWPPKLTTVDLECIDKRDTKKAQVAKLIKAHNQRSAQKSRKK